jgi:hypothetical protein
MPLQSKSPLAHPYLHGEWRWVHAECLHFGQGHAGEGGRGGPKTGLRPARGPSRGRWPGSAPRAPAAARARSREAAAASVASAASAAAPGGLGWGRPDGQTDRGHRGRAAARAGHGGRLVWRGPRGGRLGPRELRAAAPNPVAGRVLGEWPMPSPLPRSGATPVLASVVPQPALCPSPLTLILLPAGPSPAGRRLG